MLVRSQRIHTCLMFTKTCYSYYSSKVTRYKTQIMSESSCGSKRESVANTSDNTKKLRQDLPSLSQQQQQQPKLNMNYTEKSAHISRYYSTGTLNNELMPIAKHMDLVVSPFKVMRLNQFIDDHQYLQRLKEEMSHLDFNAKSNDLYRLRQSVDLNNMSDGAIGQLCALFRHCVRPLISDITNISFNDTIDLTISKYDHNDYLLCHDDELEGRRVAFILYFVHQWDKTDGGLLELFECDQNGEPSRVANSLIPEWNSFVFFEVTPESYHQVSEVLTDAKIRLSINGWFHGEPIARPKPYIEPQYQLSQYLDIPLATIETWINPLYLQDDMQLQIQENFVERSEISLQDFLCDDKYIELARALKDSEAIEWQWTRPASKRKYETASIDTVPAIVTEAHQVFRSEAFFLILSNITGLKLHELAVRDDSSEDSSDNEESTGEVSARYRGEIRRWSHSCYTLVHDNSAETRETSALDAIIHFNCDREFNRENGGFVSYIAKNEDEELLTIDPLSNCLNIIYRDRQTARFTKYINDKCHDAFHDFSFVYYE